jgi:hypothetical protein
MTSSWPCPLCGAAVEATGISSEVGGPPEIQHNHCGACGIGLIRHPGAEDERWSVNSADTSTDQCRLRLEALAGHLDLEFKVEGPKVGPPIWRCHLWEKRPPDDRSGERGARIWGSGASEEEALQEAAYEAEVQGLLA